MNYFPMYMDIKDREILICGGGIHAAEKIEKLQPFEPELRVISENISDEVNAMTGIAIENRRLTKDDLYSYPVFVIAAESKEENERIAEMCRELHIPVNAVDQPKDCGFIFPSMIVTEHLCASVSTGGVSPTGAICLKNRLSEIIPDDIDEILLWVRSLKEKLKALQVERRTLNKILRCAMDEAINKKRPLTAQETDEIVRKFN